VRNHLGSVLTSGHSRAMIRGNRNRVVPDVRPPPSGIRHDLRHQLATLQNLFSGAVSDPSALVDTARSEVGYAMELLDALPSGSPAIPVPRSGSRTPQPTGSESPDVSDVAGVLRTAARASVAGGRTVLVDARPPLHVAMSRTGLVRVVRNLLGNAVSAAGPSGTVLLRATQVDPCSVRQSRGDAIRSHVRLDVHDDGPGPGKTGFHRSGGVGLDVVRSLILPAGGWLVLGRSPYGGACASVTLPSARAA